MPKRVCPLSETQIDKAVATSKPYKLRDGNRLYLLVSPTLKGTGGKCWRFSYRFDGKSKLLALGNHPETTLDDARKLRDDAALLLAKGIDPCSVRKSDKAFEKTMEAASHSLPSIRLIMGGGVEIWKGQAVVRLTNEEAKFVCEHLAKVTQCH